MTATHTGCRKLTMLPNRLDQDASIPCLRPLHTIVLHGQLEANHLLTAYYQG